MSLVDTPQSASSRSGSATHHVADTAEQSVCLTDTDHDLDYEECYDTMYANQSPRNDPITVNVLVANPVW